MISNISGSVYIRPASDRLTQSKLTDTQSELLNWDCLDLVNEKFIVSKTEPELILCTSG